MTAWLVHNWKGFVKIRISGYSPERFFNLCNVRGFRIWGITCSRDGYYEGYMEIADFRRIRPVVRKAKVRLRITERRGLPFFVYRNRKRWYYPAGIAGFFLFLYLMTLFIWDIRFEGNYRYTSDTLLSWLKTQETYCGMRKSAVSCEELEAAMRTDFPEITWVSARISGTRLLIHIKENEAISVIPQKEDAPADIVASKDGVITSMVVRNGFPAVRPGEEVKAGQVLVQGRIPIVNDNEEETAVYYVRADADIMARTKTEYEKELPLLHTVRVPTGKKRMGVYLRAGNRSLTFLTPSFSKGEWDFQMEESQLTLFSDCYLPFYAGKILGKEVVSYEKTYSDSELEMISDTFYSLFSENLREKGVHILGNNDKIEKSISGNRISGTLITEESIVRYQPVNTTDAEETTDSE